MHISSSQIFLSLFELTDDVLLFSTYSPMQTTYIGLELSKYLSYNTTCFTNYFTQTLEFYSQVCINK